MKQRSPKSLLAFLYYLGSLALISLGGLMVWSGYQGFHWYRETLGRWLPIPSEELFHGTGGLFIVIGAVFIIAGIIELLVCPACPFPLHRKWESPTLTSDKPHS
jgi:hypothetical protein